MKANSENWRNGDDESDGCFWFVKWPAHNNNKMGTVINIDRRWKKYSKIEQVFASAAKWEKIIRSTWMELRPPSAIHQHTVMPSLQPHSFAAPSIAKQRSCCWWCSYRLFSYVTLSPTSSMRWHFVIKFNSTCAPLHFHFHFLQGMHTTSATSHNNLHLEFSGCALSPSENVKLRAQLKLRCFHFDWAKWFSFRSSFAISLSFRAIAMKKALKPTIFYFYDIQPNTE